MTQLGLITSVLEEELKRELRQQGIVVWLDKDAHYNTYVDELVDRYHQGNFFAPVVVFRGSFLEMLLILEPYCNGDDPDRLLIHVPGHTQESIRKTPILELYRAGFRFQRALDTLIRNAATGHINPTQIETYLSQNSPTLTDAELWLQTALSQPQEGLAAYLESLSLEWILDGILSPEKPLQAKILADQLPILIDHLHRHTGIDPAFRSFYRAFQDDRTPPFAKFAEAFAAWLMTVEYVHDLTRPPHLEALRSLQQLSTPLRKTCQTLIDHFRRYHPETYANLAAIVEAKLEAELSAINPEDLGQIDTFQREETAVLEKGAIQALLDGQWKKALDWATSRLDSNSFWLERDYPSGELQSNRTRRLEWTFIRDAATLGDTIQKSDRPLKNIDTLREALEYYTQSGYRVDRAHRHFEQERLKRLATLPHFAQLLEVADNLRVQYRTWADQLAQDFAAICSKESFLPDDDLQQRTLYDQVIHPLTQTNKKTAYFLIDAFRFEMATELMPELTGGSTTVLLKGRYAELPTITAVGMNVLAPVSQRDRLVLASGDGFKGFKTGEYTVRKPDERVKAMGDRSLGSAAGKKPIRSLTLTEVCDLSTDRLEKTCAGGDLIVVHSREIDDAGEANVGLASFETYLQQIKSAWSRLKSAGVSEFIFTADHGFLLRDETTQVEKIYGSKRDPARRYVLSSDPRSENEMTTVSLSALKYEGQEGYLLFRKDTAVFATGNPGATFVHGGNSLQERIIPVLMVSHRHQSSLAMVNYFIEVEPQPDLLGFSRIRVKVKPVPDAQSVLSFGRAKAISLALRVRDRADVQIIIKDAPGVEVRNQQIQVPVDADWTELLFDLQGVRDERVQLEIFHPDGIETVASATTTEFFNVSGSLQGKTDSNIDSRSTINWQTNFEDESIRNVFLHLQQHGSITEPELIQMLGNARRARSFALQFEEHLKKVPFSVRIETTSSGKRYVKQN